MKIIHMLELMTGLPEYFREEFPPIALLIEDFIDFENREMLSHILLEKLNNYLKALGKEDGFDINPNTIFFRDGNLTTLSFQATPRNTENTRYKSIFFPMRLKPVLTWNGYTFDLPIAKKESPWLVWESDWNREDSSIRKLYRKET